VNCAPDGKNINDGCGSTHIEELIPRVREGGYDAAFAFDGDADRLLVVDEAGHILDGDFLLAILADYLKQHNRLKNDTVVVTTMSNLGFFKLMEERSVRTAVTKVGDRYVLEEMLKNGHVLGGEQSGHMILLDRATTGDGQLSAVTLLEAMMDAGKPLSVLGGAMKRFPQVMVNVPATVSMKAQLDENDAVRRVIADCEAGFGNRGRVVVRASGTEPLIRVMVEGEDDQMIAHAADRIAQTIRNELI
jgi:phosphoglucosamine mutase